MNAQCTLGRLYFQGRDITKDYVQSAKWYRKAAEQGDASAQNNLGLMYNMGEGVPEDAAEAARWFRRAAAQGGRRRRGRAGGDRQGLRPRPAGPGHN